MSGRQRSVGGNAPRSKHASILHTPTKPEAASRCPTFVFAAPSFNRPRSSGRARPYTAPNACTSIGSPNDVPVPWHSTTSTSAGSNRASASAARSTFCCEVPFGAVMPELAPSWLTAVPRTTPRIRLPRACASSNRISTRTAAPSPRPYPSAASENVLLRPSEASARVCDKSTKDCAPDATCAPPTIAKSHRPDRKCSEPRCSATSDDEHAVSTAITGPCNPKLYASRPAENDIAPPVIAYAFASSTSRSSRLIFILANTNEQPRYRLHQRTPARSLRLRALTTLLPAIGDAADRSVPLRVAKSRRTLRRTPRRRSAATPPRHTMYLDDQDLDRSSLPGRSAPEGIARKVSTSVDSTCQKLSKSTAPPGNCSPTPTIARGVAASTWRTTRAVST